MSEKKAKFNEVFISGEVIDLKDARRVNEGTPQEALTYKLHIETSPGEIRVVEFFTNMFKADGTPNAMYTGIETICNEIVTKVETGQGDRVRCICKLDDNTYYSNGEKIELTKITGDFCNREEEGKTIKSDQLWRVDLLVEEIDTREDSKGEYTYVKGLVNKYGKNGFYANFRIHDPAMREGFASLYKVGSIGKLEGTFEEVVSAKSSGFGSMVKKSVERYLEVAGGDVPYEVTDTKHPFHADNIATMKEKIQTKLDKMKAKDDAKQANSTKVSNDVVPF